MNKAPTELETVPQEIIDKAILLGKALNRLRENEDFKTLILGDYLSNSVLASVSMLAVPQVKKNGERGDVLEDLVSASNLMEYFREIDMFYNSTIDPVYSDEELKEQQAAEDAANLENSSEGTH